MRAIVFLLLALSAPASLAAQDERLERLREAYPGEVGQIEAIVAEAEAAGVPGGPLIDKALEGAAKRVPGGRVLLALNAYADRLRESASIVGQEHGAGSVIAGADALRRGVPDQSMRQLVAQHRGDLAVPFMVMGDLVEAGVPAQGAYDIVDNALKQEHGPEEMLMIPGAVRRMMRSGQSASEAADFLGNAMRRGELHMFMGTGPQGMGPQHGPPVPPGSEPPGQGRKKGKGSGGKPPPGS